MEDVPEYSLFACQARTPLQKIVGGMKIVSAFLRFDPEGQDEPQIAAHVANSMNCAKALTIAVEETAHALALPDEALMSCGYKGTRITKDDGAYLYHQLYGRCQFTSLPALSPENAADFIRVYEAPRKGLIGIFRALLCYFSNSLIDEHKDQIGLRQAKDMLERKR